MAQPPKARGGGFVYFAKWKTYLNIAFLTLGILFALPNLFTDQQLKDALWEWVPARKMSLGLDLRGGSQLLMKVDVQSVIRDRLEATKDEMRDIYRDNNITYTGLDVSGNAVVAKLSNPADAEKAREVLRPLQETDMTFDVASDGSVRLEITEQGVIARQRRAVEQSIEIVRRRIDAEGVKEPSVVPSGTDRILVQVPGYDDPKRLRDIISKTAKMTFHFVDERYPPTVFEPPDAQVPPGDLKALNKDERNTQGGLWYLIEKRVMVSGENLVDANATYQQGQPVVAFEFDSVGARRFCDATTKGVGKLFAIKLDKEIISAPVIKSAICGGSGVIEGNFTVDSANQLALLLRAGALPANLEILEERSVGAELGADSIVAGTNASYMGLALIVIALVVVYGLFGLFATVALVFNFVLLIAAMSLLQATLTLPGIAGMVLTLGMAVDANVLIHERIREEIRAGRGPIMAIDAGYRSASGTITDSNLTVIISSIFLWIFGSGTVKGFAITLIIGTIISMYTAVVVARMCTVTWLRRRRPAELPI